MATREEIPQFKTLEEEKAYWEAKGPLGIEAQREGIREELELHFKNCLEYKGMDSSISGSLSRSSVLLLDGLGVVIKVGEDEIEAVDGFGASYKTKVVTVESLIKE